MRIFEQLARGDTAIAAYVSIHNMVVGMIDQHGTDEQRQTWLPAMTEMSELGSYCLTEPGAGSDAAALRTTARRTTTAAGCSMASSSSSPAPAPATSTS